MNASSGFQLKGLIEKNQSKLLSTEAETGNHHQEVCLNSKGHKTTIR